MPCDTNRQRDDPTKPVISTSLNDYSGRTDVGLMKGAMLQPFMRLVALPKRGYSSKQRHPSGAFMSLLEENAEILAGMAQDGSDLGPSRPIDFSHIFPTRPSAEEFAAQCKEDGLTGDVIETDRVEDPWDVTVTVAMQPSAANVTSWEEHSDVLARRHGGRTDGWGFFRV